MISITKILKEILRAKNVPELLYHATNKKLLNNISIYGLGKQRTALWDDPKYIPELVYLAKTPEEAFDFVITSNDNEEDSRKFINEKDIIVFEIETKNLNINKLYKDENILSDNDEEITYEYHGIIEPKYLRIVDNKEF